MFKRIINFFKKKEKNTPYLDYVFCRIDDGVLSGMVSKVGSGLSGTIYFFHIPGINGEHGTIKIIFHEFSCLCYFNDNEISLEEFVSDYNDEIKRRLDKLKEKIDELSPLFIDEN